MPLPIPRGGERGKGHKWEGQKAHKKIPYSEELSSPALTGLAGEP